MSKFTRNFTLFAAGIAALSMSVNGQAEPSSPAAAGDNIFIVKSNKKANLVAIGGSVIARKSVTLSAQMPGRVEMIAGAEGDVFSANRVLLALDDDDLKAQRRAAVARLNKALAASRDARVQLSREIVSPATRNAPGGMGMPAMMDQMFTNPMSSMMGTRQPGAERHAEVYARGVRVDQARSEIAEARSSIETIDAKLRDTHSVAPFTGVITHKYIEVGDTVQPGQPLLDFADTSVLQIQVDVPSRLMRGMKEGAMVAARLDILGSSLQVRVAKIFPTADSQRHTTTVKFDLPPDSAATAGMYAEVLLPDIDALGRHDLVVPRTSIVWQGGLPMVFVVDDQGRASLRLIRVGNPVNHRYMAVLSGLSKGDPVVEKPGPGMTTGTVVR